MDSCLPLPLCYHLHKHLVHHINYSEPNTKLNLWWPFTRLIDNEILMFDWRGLQGVLESHWDLASLSEMETPPWYFKWCYKKSSGHDPSSFSASISAPLAPTITHGIWSVKVRAKRFRQLLDHPKFALTLPVIPILITLNDAHHTSFQFPCAAGFFTFTWARSYCCTACLFSSYKDQP